MTSSKQTSSETKEPAEKEDRFGIARREGLISRWLERREKLVWGMMVAILLWQLQAWWYPTFDGSSYLSIAKSVFSGEGLRNLSSPHLHYQIGYPLLISPLMLLGEYPFLTLSIFQVLCGAVALVLIHRWATALFGRTPGLLLTLLVACHAAFQMYCRRTLSEIPSMMWMFAAGLALTRAMSLKTTRDVVLWTLASSVLVALAATTRYVALALIPGAIIAGLLAWRSGEITLKRIGLVCFVAGLPAMLLVGWLIYHDGQIAKTVNSSTSYLDLIEGQDPASRFVETLRLRISATGRMLVPGLVDSQAKSGDWLDVNVFIFAGASIIAAAGWWRLARGKPDLMVWSLPFYIGVHMVVPFDAGMRFFVPIVPLLLATVWALLETRYRWRYSAMLIMAGIHLLTGIGVQVHNWRESGNDFRTYWPACYALARSGVVEPAPGTAPDVSRSIQAMAKLALDQQTIRLEDHENVPENIRTIIQLEGARAPDGFRVGVSSGPLQLAIRDSGRKE